MRILICSDVYPGLSGIARYCEEVSNILKKNHKVTIIHNPNSKRTIKRKINGIEVIRMNFNEIKKLGHFDMVIVRWYPYLHPAVQNFQKVTYILPSVRSVSFRVTKNNMGGIKKIIRQEIEGIRKCDKIIYPSKCVKKQVEKEYNIKKGIVIYHGVNIRKFYPCKHKKFDVITVANLNDRRKGIDKLLKVVKFVRANFIVLGEGKLKREYIKKAHLFRIEKRINFLGKKESSSFFKRAKVFVLPSRYEAFGLVLLEAMASGLPVIAFKPDGKKIITASNEIIDRKVGFLVKNEKEMAEKIELLLQDDKLREKMGKDARKKAENYSWEKTARKILKVVGKS